MAGITTHILDTSLGLPAAKVPIELFKIVNGQRELIQSCLTNHDGRTDRPMLSAEQMHLGLFEMVFHVEAYLQATQQTQSTPFYDDISIRFNVDAIDEHYHIPLLLSPFGYSTYRGS